MGNLSCLFHLPHCTAGQGDANDQNIGDSNGCIEGHLDHQQEGYGQLLGQDIAGPKGHQQIRKDCTIIVLVVQ